MAKNNIKSKQGFTIIEVVLVLAIAGLIFLMVFVALPALQRSQRDTSRRNDMSRVDTSLVQYQTNHSNQSNNLPNVAVSGGKVYQSWTATTEFNTTDCGSSDIPCIFVRDYMNTGSDTNNKINEFNDPDGKPYNMVITANWANLQGNLEGVQFNENSKFEPTTATDSANKTYNGYTIGGNSPFSEHVVYIVPGGRCIGDVVVKSEQRHFAILYRLEGAGVYCIDDQ